jgi:hypothetical protein
MVLFAAYRFLAPAIRAAGATTRDAQKAELRAESLLILTILLFILLVGIFVAFRPSRFFFPRRGEPRTRTNYTDAWAESAKRLEVPPEEGEDSEDEEPK